MNWDKLAAAWPLVRDVVIVAVALAGLVFEAVNGNAVRQEMILAWTGLLLSPVVIRGDAKDRRADPPETAPPPAPREADR